MYSRHTPNVQRMIELSETRAQRAKRLKNGAGRVDAADLQAADTESLRLIVELANRCEGGGLVGSPSLRPDVLDQQHQRQLVDWRGLESVVTIEAGGLIVFGMNEYQTQPSEFGHFERFEQEVLQESFGEA